MEVVFLLALSAGAAWCALGDDVDWQRVSSDFMKQAKPYGPGDFRVRGESVISMKTAKPETKFKPQTEAEIRSDKPLEYTEDWMSDVAERGNRRTVQILTGGLSSPVDVRIKKFAQRAAWEIAPDGQTVYLAAGWQNYHGTPPAGKRYKPQTLKLFKSTDRGQTWQRLDWPENQNISFLHFLDAERGYAIGWGPHIWRTADGGASWTEIPVPRRAKNASNPREDFDIATLGNDGVLRFAFYAKHHPQYPKSSLVYALPWSADEPKLAFNMGDRTVTHMIADTQGTVYILSRPGHITQTLGLDNAAHPSAVSRWDGEHLQHLHEFDPEIVGYALYFTPSGRLMLDAVDESGLREAIIVGLSDDGGEHWELQSEGAPPQGGYYDTRTGTRWRVEGYSLYKRAIP